MLDLVAAREAGRHALVRGEARDVLFEKKDLSDIDRRLPEIGG